jgi:hypothetical protein
MVTLYATPSESWRFTFISPAALAVASLRFVGLPPVGIFAKAYRMASVNDAPVVASEFGKEIGGRLPNEEFLSGANNFLHRAPQIALPNRPRAML